MYMNITDKKTLERVLFISQKDTTGTLFKVNNSQNEPASNYI